MKHIRIYAVIAIAVLVLAGLLGGGSSVSMAQSPENVVVTFSKGGGDHQLGISNIVPEIEPLGPQAITVADDGTIYILDSLNKRIIGLSKSGQQLIKIDVPDAGFLKDMVVQNGQFYLMDIGQDAVLQVDSSGKTVETYPATGELRNSISGFTVTQSGEVRWQVEGSKEYTLQSESALQSQNRQTQAETTARTNLSITGSMGTVQTELVRLDDNRAALQIYDEAGQYIQTLYLQTKHFLGSMRLQQVDEQGNYYVLVEELLEDIPAFVVDTTIRRFSKDGILLDIAKVPITGVYFLPQRFTAVSRSGEAYFLRVQSNSAEVARLSFVNSYQSDLEARWAALKPQLAAQEAEIAAHQSTINQPQNVQGTITRDQIMANARAYLHINWVLGYVNTVNNTKLCWALPGYLSGRIEQTIPEAPYKWGGYSTVDEIRNGINAGKLAGDACTTDILWTAAVGVDCSGYVSRVWNEARYTTYSLPNISTQINWNDLKRGDIANWVQGHVMLFASFKNGSNINGGINAYEATSNCNWKVCYSSFRSFSYLNSKYVPRRYNNVIEDPTNQPPSAPALTSPANGDWQSSRTVALNWNTSNDDGLPNGSTLKYTVEVWRSDNAWRTEKGALTATAWNLTTTGDGTFYWHVKASDGDKSSGWSATRSFRVDTTAPTNPTSINSGCSAQNNVWQNSCSAPAFTWNAANDHGGIGVTGYEYQWRNHATGTPLDSGSRDATTRSYSPAAVTTGSYALQLRSKDSFDHWAAWQNLFILRYDSTDPTLSLSINNGATTTNQTGVRLNLSATDTSSGVRSVRISNNNIIWTDWQPYTDEIDWTLPALDHHNHTVYVQIRDRAGNVSAIAFDDIYLDLYPPMPHSNTYRICQDVMNIGGSTNITSTGYRLSSSIGQPWSTGANPNASNAFSEGSGFLANTNGCLPIEHVTTNLFTVTQSVIASGGRLRSSAGYRVGDTLGETAASKAGEFNSAGYKLTSGFWASITGTVPATSTVATPTPTPIPTLTPTPGPTATPQPSGFGVSLNNGALYTNNSVVTVSVQAPNVIYMRLSNDGGYSDDNWQPYRVSSTHVISTYGSYIMPRYVYVWFKDADNAVYGAYFDDIIYDPVAPYGWGYISEQTGSRTTLSLYGYDNVSGVSQMQLSFNADLSDAEWVPYTTTQTLDGTGGTVYFRFSDAASNISPIYSTDQEPQEPPTNIYDIYLPLVLK